MTVRAMTGKPAASQSPVELLSDRELEVFEKLGQGIGTRQIAEDLGVNVKTVQAYCARIKEKLNLTNATELLREAILWNKPNVHAELISDDTLCQVSPYKTFRARLTDRKIRRRHSGSG